MTEKQSQEPKELKSLVKDFPELPGVYLMKDQESTVIYVGKAKRLLHRVRSYFTGNKDIKTRFLVQQIHTIDYIVTNSEEEALILENNLIKEYRPRFNIDLKDDKSYPVIRLTADPFPRVFKTRKIVQDGSEYFGPYPNVRDLDIYLDLIEKLFPLRKCKGPLKKRKSPCLYHHMGKCDAPCVGGITQEAYGQQVQAVRDLLKGRTAELLRELRGRMGQASQELRFEAAAEIRNRIQAIENLGIRSTVVDHNPEARDYIHLAAEGHLGVFVVFRMREGKLLGREVLSTEWYGTREEAWEEFLMAYYGNHEVPGGSITLGEALPAETLELLSRLPLFSTARRGKVYPFVTPAENRWPAILKLCRENARMELDRRRKEGGMERELGDLQEVLGMPVLPRRIEGFDIAQLDGTNPVASLISFHNGRPDKKQYRKFHIRSLKGAIDDYQSIQEAVARRYSRLLNEDGELPDLIMVDGGKGQVSAAWAILQGLGLDIPLCGLAKQNEEIFLPGRSEPIVLPAGSPALRILQAVRDETHRFATRFNQGLRRKALNFNTLEGLPGIGPARSRRLMEQFRSLEGLMAAEPGEISRLGGIPREMADTLKTYLKDRSEREGGVKAFKRSRKS